MKCPMCKKLTDDYVARRQAAHDAVAAAGQAAHDEAVEVATAARAGEIAEGRPGSSDAEIRGAATEARAAAEAAQPTFDEPRPPRSYLLPLIGQVPDDRNPKYVVQRFRDPAGKNHEHDGRVWRAEVKCSLGHHFFYDQKVPCPVAGCSHNDAATEPKIVEPA